MKKNKMLRLASGLLVLTLLTTCIISGTFAKYVTSASGSDAARVAKWGVEVTTSGSLFEKHYNYAESTDTTITTTTESYSVETTTDEGKGNNDKLVAPGTENETGLTFSITGKPEVAVRIDVKVTDGSGDTDNSPKDVFLAAGTYADLTTGNSMEITDGESQEDGGDTDTFTVATPYYPVKYTLEDGQGKALLTDAKLSEVAEYFENLSGDYEPNTDLAKAIGNTNTNKSQDGTYILTWKWDFTDDTSEEIDKKDTLLGSLAADPTILAKQNTDLSGNTSFVVLESTDYSTETSVKIEISVTQID